MQKSTRRSVTAPLCCLLMESQERTFFLREHHSSNLSFGWSGGGGATIVLEDLGADAPATVTRAEFGMCAWCAFAYQQ